MSVVLRPYPEYRPSGLPWLGAVPAHWEERRARYVFREVDERSTTGEEVHLSMTQQHGLLKSSLIEKWRLQSESYAGGKLCTKGDLVLNRLKAHLGVFAHAAQGGVVSPDYTVYRPVPGIAARYFEALFKTPMCIVELRRATRGIVEGFWRLYTDDFYDIRVPVPPAGEQYQILAWIDQYDRSIRRYIRNKQRLVALLQEQKQAIIDRAVTRGVDGGVRLKPSGIEWLGDVPAHWQVVRLKDVATVVLGKMLKTSRSEGEELKPYLRAANIQWGKLWLDDVAEMWFSPGEAESLRLKVGDVLVSEGGEVGRSCVWDGELPECYIQNSVHRVTPKCSIRPLFLFYQFLIMGKHGYLDSIVNRVSIGHLTREKLVDVQIAVPPVDEQDNLIKMIARDTLTPEGMAQRAQRQINLMREYRARLIADVVTGKLDVRHVAPEELPMMVDGMATPGDVAESLAGEPEEVNELDGVEEEDAEGWGEAGT